jgi:hypothetical protein
MNQINLNEMVHMGYHLRLNTSAVLCLENVMATLIRGVITLCIFFGINIT